MSEWMGEIADELVRDFGAWAGGWVGETVSERANDNGVFVGCLAE